jgi:hypothetical protein
MLIIRVDVRDAFHQYFFLLCMCSISRCLQKQNQTNEKETEREFDVGGKKSNKKKP